MGLYRGRGPHGTASETPSKVVGSIQILEGPKVGLGPAYIPQTPTKVLSIYLVQCYGSSFGNGNVGYAKRSGISLPTPQTHLQEPDRHKKVSTALN